MPRDEHRHWSDRLLRVLAIVCVFWAGAVFAVGSLTFVGLLIAAGVAWTAAD